MLLFKLLPPLLFLPLLYTMQNIDIYNAIYIDIYYTCADGTCSYTPVAASSVDECKEKIPDATTTTTSSDGGNGILGSVIGGSIIGLLGVALITGIILIYTTIRRRELPSLLRT
jgi:hypothetical protein